MNIQIKNEAKCEKCHQLLFKHAKVDLNINGTSHVIEIMCKNKITDENGNKKKCKHINQITL